eukprot:g23629.t1
MHQMSQSQNRIVEAIRARAILTQLLMATRTSHREWHSRGWRSRLSPRRSSQGGLIPLSPQEGRDAESEEKQDTPALDVEGGAPGSQILAQSMASIKSAPTLRRNTAGAATGGSGGSLCRATKLQSKKLDLWTL